MGYFCCRTLLLLLSGLVMLPLRAGAADVLQCVPYARTVSGVDLRGDALTWWDQAENRFKRGHKPKMGAVLAFRPYGPMTLGHVAVVSKVLGDREVLVRHANWSAPGAIEEDVLAIDVSQEGDWSAVRVWHSPSGQMGARTNPTFGFIYPAKSRLHDFVPDDSLGASVRLASNGSPTTRSRIEKVQMTRPAPPRRMVAMEQATPADPFIIEYESASNRSLGDIVNDLKREASL